MTRLRRILAVSIALFLISTQVSALIWSGPDGDGHPYVGVVVFDVDSVPSHLCSGTLLSPTVFLTAGHCTSGTSAARVWFESEVTDPHFPFGGGTSISGTPYTHPDSWAGFPNTSDVGIVVLAEPVEMSTYGQLAPIGALNSLATRRGLSNQLFTLVGYGQQAVVPFPSFELVRYRATPQLVNLNSALTGGFNIHLSSNPGRRAPGGACFGDSGGPALIGASNIVGGVGSFVLSPTCVGSSFYFRVDTEQAQDFILSFLD